MNLIQLPFQALEKIRDNMPTLEDEVTVEVVGQPGSNKQQLYFLALATANGMVTKLGASLTAVSGSFGMLMIEYDAANDWVRCTLRYKWGMAAANVLLTVAAVADPTAPASRFELDNLEVYRGPSCNVVGGKFDFTSDTLPGIPASSKPSVTSNAPPKLPFEGQMILTPCPTTPEPVPTAITQNPALASPLKNTGPEILSPNPKPPGDNRSRGAVYVSQGQLNSPNGPLSSQNGVVPSTVSDPKICCNKFLALIPMVYAALSAPATNSQMTFPNPVSGPKGG